MFYISATFVQSFITCNLLPPPPPGLALALPRTPLPPAPAGLHHGQASPFHLRSSSARTDTTITSIAHLLHFYSSSKVGMTRMGSTQSPTRHHSTHTHPAATQSCRYSGLIANIILVCRRWNGTLHFPGVRAPSIPVTSAYHIYITSAICYLYYHRTTVQWHKIERYGCRFSAATACAQPLLICPPVRSCAAAQIHFIRSGCQVQFNLQAYHHLKLLLC